MTKWKYLSDGDKGFQFLKPGMVILDHPEIDRIASDLILECSYIYSLESTYMDWTHVNIFMKNTHEYIHEYVCVYVCLVVWTLLLLVQYFCYGTTICDDGDRN